MLDLVHTDIYENEELKHWGIIGMKWGIRRYQNPDGSLTPEGRERYLSKGYPNSFTKEGKERFFNKDYKSTTEYAIKRGGVSSIPIGLGVGLGAVSPLGPGVGAALGASVSVLGNLMALNTYDQGLTPEGSKFFYDQKTGKLSKEAKKMMFDEVNGLTNIGRNFVEAEQYREKSSNHPSINKIYKIEYERQDELSDYIKKNILPICGDMPVGLYLEKEWNSDNPSKEYKAYESYVKQLNKKYYKRFIDAT